MTYREGRPAVNNGLGRVASPTNGRAGYHEKYQEFKEKGSSFWPHIIFEDVVAGILVLVGLLLLTVFWGVPLEEKANPINTSYFPRPEWYFMFLFQLLKVFPGELEWVGIVLVPAAGVLALLLLPFVDRREVRRPARRPFALGLAGLAILLVFFLTVRAFQATPSAGGTSISPGAVAGKQLFLQQGCNTCHSVGGQGGSLGPTLDGVASRMPTPTINAYIANPKAVNPESAMPSYSALTSEELEKLANFLATLK